MINIFSDVILQIIKDKKEIGQTITQNELAKVLGTSKQSFSNKMKRDTFTVDDIIKISNYLNMEIVIKSDEIQYTIK